MCSVVIWRIYNEDLCFALQLNVVWCLERQMKKIYFIYRQTLYRITLYYKVR